MELQSRNNILKMLELRDIVINPNIENDTDLLSNNKSMVMCLDVFNEIVNDKVVINSGIRKKMLTLINYTIVNINRDIDLAMVVNGEHVGNMDINAYLILKLGKLSSPFNSMMDQFNNPEKKTPMAWNFKLYLKLHSFCINRVIHQRT